ncbi:MAG: MCP four helix bundle domain-containing protein [Nitrospira sp.]
MKRFDNLQTKFELLATFGTMALLLVSLGVIAMVGMHTIGERSEAIYRQNLVPIEILADLRDELQQIVTFVAWHKAYATIECNPKGTV